MQNNKHHKPKNTLRVAATSLFLLMFIASAAVLFIQNVPKAITREDRNYIEKILTQNGTDIAKLKQDALKDFTNEIRTIRTVQSSAFITAPKVELIPYRHEREPKDLFTTDAAYCGDRARYIDKALRYLGFDTRYASLYQNRPQRSFLSTILTKTSTHDVDSHALVEVKTSKGWLIVDTRRHWISLSAAMQPISLRALRDKQLSYFEWSYNQEESWPLLDENYYIIYELYSRHGLFYAPYTKYIPDIHWPGFIKHNFRQFFAPR